MCHPISEPPIGGNSLISVNAMEMANDQGLTIERQIYKDTIKKSDVAF